MLIKVEVFYYEYFRVKVWKLQDISEQQGYGDKQLI